MFRRRIGRMQKGVQLFINIIVLIILNNLLRATVIVKEMNRCGAQFRVDDLSNSKELQAAVSKFDGLFGVIMLNNYALNITLNWLCNTANMPGVHERILFFTLDREAEHGLLRHYPNLVTFRWQAPCLRETFSFGDARYMSFFLLRTNLVRALLRLKKSFWMLQADTFWSGDLLSAKNWLENEEDILLDQQGYEDMWESRKGVMNGANFLVHHKENTVKLIEEMYWYQSRFYVTDPDAIKIMCRHGSTYSCAYVDHSLISGWEWIYGKQKNAPLLIQLDGEVKGGKLKTLQLYKMWFIDDAQICDSTAVRYATRLVASGQIANKQYRKAYMKWALNAFPEICLKERKRDLSLRSKTVFIVKTQAEASAVHWRIFGSHPLIWLLVSILRRAFLVIFTVLLTETLHFLFDILKKASSSK